jgi:hypothetical protein
LEYGNPVSRSTLARRFGESGDCYLAAIVTVLIPSLRTDNEGCCLKQVIEIGPPVSQGYGSINSHQLLCSFSTSRSSFTHEIKVFVPIMNTPVR